jgi:chemotaxis protein histidine kinase CheA
VKTKDFSGIRNNGSLPDPQEVEIHSDMSDLLEDYVESANSMLEELERATLAYEKGYDREENAAAIRRILHKIKGESGMVGIEDVGQLCHEAEFAFAELGEDLRPDMLLRFKDWTCAAINHLTAQASCGR